MEVLFSTRINQTQAGTSVLIKSNAARFGAAARADEDTIEKNHASSQLQGCFSRKLSSCYILIDPSNAFRLLFKTFLHQKLSAVL